MNAISRGGKLFFTLLSLCSGFVIGYKIQLVSAQGQKMILILQPILSNFPHSLSSFPSSFLILLLIFVVNSEKFNVELGACGKKSNIGWLEL